MKQKILTTILILFACANIGNCAQSGGLQGRIKLQDSSAISNKANVGAIDSTYMEMMNNPMLNGAMNMMQNGVTGSYQQMEQAKQQADFVKQQANYAQQIEKEDDN